MIKNIVFDLGRVLIDFNPAAYIKGFGYDNKTNDRLLEVIFKSKAWVELDRGTLDEQGAIELFCKHEPYLTCEIREVMSKWKDMLVPKKDTVIILKERKTKGYKLYILSNYHRKAYEETKAKNDFFKLFDGEIVSSKFNVIKPEREIYQILLKRYSLVPEETLFIDDSMENIIAAEEQSIKAICFSNAQDLRNDLKKFGITL